ncbi:MAG: polyphosphate kinase 2 family protein [Acidobacteria bacterium]|nr:polyphosphate kinase 2 family protein [Acidobacteriota bacterium]
MKLKSAHLVPPHTKVRLSHVSTHDQDGFADKTIAETLMVKHREELNALQEVFYASQAKAMLIVLQGMDTAGKDGTIRHIFSGINPQGCDVSSFKVPTPLEARHEFLWRCQKRVPARGMIGIFNRSHYEDVLSTRVHGLIDAKTARRRMDDINAWEQSLTDENVVVLKFYLHISREEQTERLQSRIDTPDKRWKLSPADFAERQYWPKYINAYEDILSHTSKKHAPWFVIPSDHKWYRNVAVSTILVDVMRRLKLQYPAPTFDPKGLNLKEEAPATAAKIVKKRAETQAK